MLNQYVKKKKSVILVTKQRSVFYTVITALVSLNQNTGIGQFWRKHRNCYTVHAI